MPNFLELGIKETWVSALKENGIAVPTPVQAETIPLALAERDVIARAKTGTGKTLAFLLPIMQKLDTTVLSRRPDHCADEGAGAADHGGSAEAGAGH